MNVSGNFSTPSFGAVYLTNAAQEVAAKARSYIGTQKSFDAANNALQKAAGKLDIIVEGFGDKGAAVWKGDVQRPDIYKKTEFIVSKEGIIDAFNVAAAKLNQEREKLAPKQIRQRFPGTNGVAKLDKTV